MYRSANVNKEIRKLDSRKRKSFSPQQKARYYFERAKQLFTEGGNCSLALERIIRDVTKAITLHGQQIEHYLFLAVVYRKSLDFGSAIFCIRYVLRMEPGNYTAREMLSSILVARGQEYVCEAISRKDSNMKDFNMVLYRKAKSLFDEGEKLIRNKRSMLLLEIISLFIH
jgi:hypothetical protein